LAPITRFLEEPTHEHGIAFVRPDLQYVLDMESHLREVGKNSEIEGDLVIEKELDIYEDVDIEAEMEMEENVDKEDEENKRGKYSE
jgi:hypothetical protein